jgi:hypothetical protein
MTAWAPDVPAKCGYVATHKKVGSQLLTFTARGYLVASIGAGEWVQMTK